MNAIWHVSWGDLFLPQPSWGEKVLRPLLVYVILLVLFRLASKREMAQATLFDFLIILLISNVVQNAMIGNDNSVLGAGAGAVTLILLSAGLNRVTARNRRMRRLLEGQPMLLVQYGDIDEVAMKRHNISRNDLLAAIRKQSLARLSDVAFAVLELDGSISIIRMDDDHRPHDCLPFEIAGDESADHDDSGAAGAAGAAGLQHVHRTSHRERGKAPGAHED